MQLTQSFLNSVIDIAYQAGEKILSMYRQQSIDIVDKSDGSPLTQADLVAHQTIVDGLTRLAPDIPLLSEESMAQDISQRRQWPILWLVDPLDGTKEFIHRTNEFTVNIALVIDHRPVLGVVYAPALGVMYFAMDGTGAYKEFNGKRQKICASLVGLNSAHSPLKVIASRRHGGGPLEKFLQQLTAYELVNVGSALKICLIAEGVADIYPRLGPTSEWDTAAGHAIINNAGGILCDAQYRPFKYNMRDTLLNGAFIVCHKDAPRFNFAKNYD